MTIKGGGTRLTSEDAATKCVYKLRAKVPKSKYTRTKSATPGEADKYKLAYGLDMVTDSGIAVFKMMVDGQYLSFPHFGSVKMEKSWVDITSIGVECGSMSTEYV